MQDQRPFSARRLVWRLGGVRSPVQVIAAMAVIRREAEQLTRAIGNRGGLAGEVANLESQSSVIGTVRWAREAAIWGIHLAFAPNARKRPQRGGGKMVKWTISDCGRSNDGCCRPFLDYPCGPPQRHYVPGALGCVPL
jgi:hypothetical protein